MIVTRRHILKLLGGGAVGTIFSPIPWKLLRDSSVWTQNWSWLPVPQRGPVGSAYSACTLCPSGCGLKVRTIGGRPVLVNGISNTAWGKGGLCPAGTAIHQMPWHPGQLRSVKMRQADGRFMDGQLDVAVDAVAAAIKGANGTVAILDGRPGRLISGAYREFLAGKGVIVQPPSVARSSMRVLRSLFKEDPGPLAIDVDQVKTVVSFSASVLENFGQPGLLQQSPKKIRTIQFEAIQSRTALKADQWVPIKPGTEREIALGLANLLLKKGYAADWDEESRTALEKICAEWTPSKVFAASGVDEATLSSVANTMEIGSTVVVGGPDAVGGPLAIEAEASIQTLNLLLGSVGQAIKPVKIAADDPAFGAIDAVETKDLTDVPAQSIEVLIIDMAMAGYALPWNLLADKLAPKALVVSLTPVLDDLAQHSQVVIPTALPFTTVQDIPGHPDFSRSVRMAQAFGAPADNVLDPVDFLNRLGKILGINRDVTAADSLSELIEKQAEVLVNAKEGVVLQPKKDPADFDDIDEADELLKRFKRGACFVAAFGQIDTALRFSFDSLGKISDETKKHDFTMQLILTGGVERASLASRSPILSKVDQESGLNPFADGAHVNPETIANLALLPKKRCVVNTPEGSIKVQIRPDPTVPPGAILMSGAPNGPKPWDVANPVELASPGQKSWRIIPAVIKEA